MNGGCFFNMSTFFAHWRVDNRLASMESLCQEEALIRLAVSRKGWDDDAVIDED